MKQNTLIKEEEMLNLFRAFISKSQYEISRFLNSNASLDSKALSSSLVLDIFHSMIGKEITKEIYLKYQVKTIRVEENGKVIQSMSSPAFSFLNLVNEDWEDSWLRNQIADKRFFFIVFQKQNEEYFLRNTFFWSMPQKDKIELMELYNRTKKILRDGVILHEEGNQVRNNLPKKNENRIGHVRPHAQKSSYEPLNQNADELPDGRWMTKQCFFINNDYIAKIIDNY